MPTRPFPNRLALVLVGVAAVVACAASRSSEPFSVVTVEDVARMLGAPKVAIVDANPREVFDEGHLPGARWYRSGPSLASVLPEDRSAKLVFYCASPS
jgi:rhodanese-related sulfurtransferase